MLERVAAHPKKDGILRMDGGTYALTNPVPIDGRLSWYPEQVRGFAPVNVYLLTSGDSALLIDCGISAHRHRVLDQIASCIGSATALSVAHTRIGECTYNANTTAVHEAFGIETVYGNIPEPEVWLECRPHGERPEKIRRPRKGNLKGVLVRDGDEIAIDPERQRRIRAILPDLRLLGVLWYYDEQTRTLFTGDAFTHVWSSEENGPWLIDNEATRVGGMAANEIREHMLMRFWWTAKAPSLKRIREGLAALFEGLQIETIAPAYGGIIYGRQMVAHHYSAMQEALATVEGSRHGS